MPIRVVIVDDEKPARDRIRRFLADHPDFLVVGEAANAAAAAELIDRERPDLCFLDVQMPEGGGFETLRRAGHHPRIIFTTAYEQYAVRAFEVNSIDYLLKPFDKKRFASALARARQAMRAEPVRSSEMGQLVQLLEEIRAGLPRSAAENTPGEGGGLPPEPAGAGGGADVETAPVGRIAARRGGKIVLLEPTEILCFEAEETLVFARTRSGGKYLVNRTLSDLEAHLDPSRFFRSHRRYLINLSLVGEILPGDEGNYRIVLRDEARSLVPLSRRQARRLRSIIPW